MIIFKILSVLIKIITIGVYTYDYTTTKKLLLEKKAVRELYLHQKVECFIFFFLAYGQAVIPLTIIKPYYSTLIQLVIFIAVYIHLNRWVFLGRHVIICRAEAFKTDRVRPTYQKHILKFRSGNRSFSIHHPLATDELIKKCI